VALIHRKKEMRKAILVIAILLMPIVSYSQEIDNYLIREDIGSYKRITKGGPSGNLLAGAKHFGADHTDRSYGIAYVNDEDKMWVDVQVTQHAGGDSDRWLAHEAERDFRNDYGLPGDNYIMRLISEQTIMAVGSGGWVYRWLSGTKVIQIEYTDLMMTKPEPLEVVNAYLAKHPSTLPSMTSADLRTDENKTKWIKDEMERRLWLCDKWLQQLDEGKTEQYKALSAVVDDHLDVFLDYREKYYGISAAEDKQTLSGYLLAKNEKEIRKKLAEYKQWWAENKTKSINLS
jgi:hypothetical protein